MQKQTYDVLVIGGGPAGIFAASLAHIKGLKSILIEANDYLGGQPLMIYSQKTIEDYPGYARIKAYQLIDNFIAQLKQTKVSVLLKTKLISYVSNDGSFVINLSNKKKICAKAIIVATGPGMFTPNRLEIPVDKHKNIEYNVNQLDSYKNLNVVILGGGDSAVD
jgi:thioredoxin reductase (NADPH)